MAVAKTCVWLAAMLLCVFVRSAAAQEAAPAGRQPTSGEETHRAQHGLGARRPVRFDFRSLFEVSGDDSFLYAKGTVPVFDHTMFGADRPNLHTDLYLEAYYNIDKGRMERGSGGVLLSLDVGKYSTFMLSLCGTGLNFENSAEEQQQERLLGTNGTAEANFGVELHWPHDNLRLGEHWRWQPYFSETYTFNLEHGRGTLNVLSAGIRFLYKESWEFTIGWRHEDIVHGPDTDQIVLAVGFKF